MGVMDRPRKGLRRRHVFGRTLQGGVSIAALCAIATVLPAQAQQNQNDTPVGGQTPAPVASSVTGNDSAVLVAQAATPAADGSLEEIIVTGFRKSLQSAQEIKQNADSIVDSVTAEDIGALPDRSVTEALQRIPGVSINRFAAGVDPDHFSVEGSGVVVRGLTYVRSEFNGREAFSANNGRALGFADVPSELMGGVDVFKSPTADRIEGGIAGVVNLRTRKPFDSAERMLAASAEMSYGDFVKKTAPTGSVLYSDRWDTKIGEIGILGSAVGSQLKTRADRFQLSSFRVRNLYSNGDVVQNPDGQPAATITDQVLFPRGAVVGTQEFDRQRYGYAGAAQWRSPDNSMEAVFTFLRSDSRQAWTEHAVEIATDNVANNGDSRRVPGTTLEFDSSGMFESGVITGPNGWRADQNTGSARVPISGLQSNNIRRDHDEKLVTDDYGFNFRWDATENLGINFDYQHVKSKTWIMDNGLWTSSYQDVAIDMNGGKGYPTVEFRAPQVCSGPAQNYTTGCSGAIGEANNPSYFGPGHTTFADPYNAFYRSAMDHIEDSDGNSDAARIDFDYKMEDSTFFKSVQAGYRYADRRQTARFSTYNWGRLSEQWGNDGPVWLTDPVDNVVGGTGGTAPTQFENFTYPKFFRGKFPDPLLGQGRVFYSGNSVKDYQAYIAYAGAINREWEPTVTGADGVVRNGGWNALGNRAGVIAGTPFLPGEINPIREENNAGYLLTKFDTDFDNGWNLTGNVGVRYTTTDRTADGFIAFPTPSSAFPTDAACAEAIAEAATSGQAIPAFCTFTPAVRAQARAYTNNALTPSSVKIKYDYWLPNLNVKLTVDDGVQFRASYFKGVAPPSTGLTRNFFNVNLNTVQNVDANGNAIVGSYRLQGEFNAGNPYLRPTTADNYDLTAEWYFSNVGQLTGSLFYKRLKGVLTNSTVRYPLTNNGVTFDSIVTTPVNADEDGKIKGFEIAYQQTYDFLPSFFSGFGLQANYTYVDSKGVPQSTLSETDPDVGAGRVTTVDMTKLPLQGLSKHQFNITPFWDYGPISARVSYSWRSDFVLTIRDVIFPYDPIINESGGQWDASFFYSFNDNFKLGVQGANLLNQVTKTSAVVTGPDGENTKVPRGWYMNDRRITAVARFTY